MVWKRGKKIDELGTRAKVGVNLLKKGMLTVSVALVCVSKVIFTSGLISSSLISLSIRNHSNLILNDIIFMIVLYLFNRIHKIITIPFDRFAHLSITLINNKTS